MKNLFCFICDSFPRRQITSLATLQFQVKFIPERSYIMPAALRRFMIRASRKMNQTSQKGPLFSLIFFLSLRSRWGWEGEGRSRMMMRGVRVGEGKRDKPNGIKFRQRWIWKEKILPFFFQEWFGNYESYLYRFQRAAKKITPRNKRWNDETFLFLQCVEIAV